MKIVVKKVGQKPEVKEIENELHVLQEIVGGYIECFQVFDNVICVCNEEGKLKGLPINFIFGGDIIVGDVFFVATGEEDFESLDNYQIKVIMNIMNTMTAVERARKKKQK